MGVLAREALRIATVEALRGATSVGENVFNSELGAVEDWVKDRPEPSIIVYTDDSQSEPAAENDLFGGSTIDLVIEVVMTQVMKIRIDGADEVVWDAPPTDAAMELTIGLIEREVLATLAAGQSDWAEIWRQLRLSTGQHQSRRGNSLRDGVRFAGRQIVMSVTTLRDPAPGATITETSAWKAFLDRVDATPTLSNIAPVLHRAIKGDGTVLRAHEVLAGRYGLSVPSRNALMLASGTATDAAITTLVNEDA